MQRIDWDCALTLMRRKQHFIRQAARRCGKTSAVAALPNPLNSGSAGACRRVRVNLESGQSAPEDVALALRSIPGEFALRVQLVLDVDFICGKDGIRRSRIVSKLDLCFTPEPSTSPLGP